MAFSTELSNLGKTGEEKQSFVGQSPKVTFKTLEAKRQISKGLVFSHTGSAPPRPPRSYPPPRPLPSPLPPLHVALSPGAFTLRFLPLVENKSLRAWVLPPGPPCTPAFQSSAWISKAPARASGEHLTPSKGAAGRRAQAAWVHMKGQLGVSCSQTAGHLPRPVGVSVGWGGGLEGVQCTRGLGFSLCKFRGWDQMVSKGPHTLQGSGFSAPVVHHSPLCREMPAP